MNELKYENYKEQMKRLNLSIKNKFYLEAIFIEYSILEDRTDALVRYCCGGAKASKYHKIAPRINKLKAVVGDKHLNINRYISLQLLERTLEWINVRNSMIHALMKRTNSTVELENLVTEGLELVKKFNTKSISFKRRIEKLNNLKYSKIDKLKEKLFNKMEKINYMDDDISADVEEFVELEFDGMFEKVYAGNYAEIRKVWFEFCYEKNKEKYLKQFNLQS